MAVRVDIVLPCYNPPAGWHNAVIRFYEFIAGRFDLRFIIVNDGSESGDVRGAVNALSYVIPVKFISQKKNRGKGFALRRGVRSSESKFIVYTDIDLPFTHESMERLTSLLVKGDADIVAGNRNDGYYKNKMSPFRRGLSKRFRYFIKHGLKMDMNDTQCGLKGFNEKGRLAFLATKINRYLFDFEFIFGALRDKTLKVRAVDVELKNDVVFTKARLPVLLKESGNLVEVLFRALVSKKN